VSILQKTAHFDRYPSTAIEQKRLENAVTPQAILVRLGFSAAC
jgi:hypothetical protein